MTNMSRVVRVPPETGICVRSDTPLFYLGLATNRLKSSDTRLTERIQDLQYPLPVDRDFEYGKSCRIDSDAIMAPFTCGVSCGFG